MARSVDTKPAAARSKMPAKRAPARSKPDPGKAAAAVRPGRAEEQAATPVSVNAVVRKNGIAAPQDPHARAAAAPPEQAPAAAAVSPAAEPPAGTVAPPTPQPEPQPEQVTSAPAPGIDPAGAALAGATVAAEAARAAADLGAAVAAVWPNRGLVEDTMRMHGEMIAFACRQTEFGLAASRAMLASRSLPEMLSRQSEFVGRSVENLLAHTREVTRLSTGLLRQGIRSGRAR